MSTQQGMITDADGDIAALVYATGDRPDLVLLDFARHVSDSGRRICGLIQFRDRRSDHTRRRVMVLNAWTEVDVSHETSTVGGGHCHVDEGWMDRMAAQVRAAADTYEVSAYKQIEVVLKSGKSAWVYVEA